MKFFLLRIAPLLLFAVIGCSSGKELSDPTLSATLWVQRSAEYDALTTTIYRSAEMQLATAVSDTGWDALPKPGSGSSRPLAVILDVDETVLDNSPFQARMITQNSSYNIEEWNEWVREARAEAVPGALSFTQRADSLGVAVFYLTNREHRVDSPTRKNLRELGFPLSSRKDRLLTKNEQPGWTSAKTSRRSYITDRYRVLMVFGDDLNDFVAAKGISMEQREQLIRANSDQWGTHWFVLPNPVYGSWEQALYNFDETLSNGQKKKIKRDLLDTGTRQ